MPEASGHYGTILVFLFFAAALVFVSIAFARLIQPRNMSAEKLTTYECGEDPTGEARIRYNFRFYTIALTFIIFGAEILFMFPWAIVYLEFIAAGEGLMTFVKMIIFIGILTVGLIYAWAQGDLDWVKPQPAFTDKDVGLPPQSVFRGYRQAPAPLASHDSSQEQESNG